MIKPSNVITAWDKNQKIVFLKTFYNTEEEREKMFEVYDQVREEYPYWAMQNLERFSEMIEESITLGENELLE